MAKAIGSGWWPGQQNDSQESQAFWMRNGEALTAIQESIKAAFAEHNGASILLWDAALRGIIAGIADGLSQYEIKIEEDN
jgi:hypothetical protein